MFKVIAGESRCCCGSVALTSFVLTVIFQSAANAGDSEPMRVFYPGQSTTKSPVGVGPSTPQYTPANVPPIGISGGSNDGMNNNIERAYSGGNSFTGGTSNTGNKFVGGSSGPRGLVGGAGGHLPSSLPNPATMPFQGGQSAADAEHQRVLENMRRAGYSDARIKVLDGYTHQSADPPGTTYRVINGIKVRNDGMTAGQAFENVINNGVMNTPIERDPHYYARDSYGYYHNSGGKKTFAQWLKGER